MEEFGFTVQQASFAFSCASIAFVTCSPISGFVADKIPKHRMKTMITAGLLLNSVSASSLLWSAGWSLPARMVYGFCFCFCEGLISTITFAPALPDMHRSAGLARRQGGSAAGIPPEAATNCVTSVFMTVQTFGGVLGPAIGAPLLSRYGFRVTLPICGSLMLVFGVLFAALLCCGCVDGAKPDGPDEDASVEHDGDGEGESDRLLSSS